LEKERYMAATIWVNRSNLHETSVHEEAMPALGDGEVRLKIDSFSVTANNITYAVIGDMFGYWNFFPAAEGRGVVPMWGHATVDASNHPDIAAGERVYGYLPMGEYLDVLPGKISAGGFTDMATHRQPMSPIYNQYSRINADLEHNPLHENARMIFAPLFKTGFLIEDMFRRENWFGAEALLMTSASSKTSMGLASCAKQSSPQIKRIGLTSAGNVGFVEGTGLYDEVIAYGQETAIAKVPSVAVDFAGNAKVGRAVHTHLADVLKYSCSVGMTHVDGRVGSVDPLPGPKPILFFAPDHAMASIKEHGAKGFGEAVAKSWKEFLGAVHGTVIFDERTGIAAAAQAYLATLNGTADPAVGIIIKP
jgi:hypothetical protein